MEATEPQQEYKNGLLNAIPHPGGRPPKYKTAEELWNRFCEYVEHIDANPWKSASRNRRQKQGDLNIREAGENERLIRRPYTLTGFGLFAGIYNWPDYRRKKANRKEFAIVIRAIEEFIKDNQITGAIIGEFSSNIIARLNNLADTQVVRQERIEDTWTEAEIKAEKERLAKHFT